MSVIFMALLVFAGIAGTIIGIAMASEATAGVAIIAASARVNPGTDRPGRCQSRPDDEAVKNHHGPCGIAV